MVTKNDYGIRINYSNFFSSLDKLQASYPEVAKKVIVELAGEAESIAKTRFTPYKYGNLRSTIRVVVTTDKISLVAGGIVGMSKKPVLVDYAYFQNYGTSRIAPKLFMERSIDLALTKTDSLSKNILSSWLSVLNV